MTLDMANFSIGVIKPDIVAASVEYEKKHFKNLLEAHPGIQKSINAANFEFEKETTIFNFLFQRQF